jgi:tRNA modification GTPase
MAKDIGGIMLSHDEQTIIAQCTPQGAGALALLRLSGADAIMIVQKIARLGLQKNLNEQTTHTIHYGSVVDNNGTLIDKVLFLLMRGPHTFTGQDTVEITCHNNPFIIEAIIKSALQAGARMAHEGEFSKRAVLNNKIDLLQAEAINELIHANNQQSLKQSLAQLDGSFSNHIQKIEKLLIKALAYTDASFEFIDEENLEFAETIATIIASILDTIQTLLRSFDQQKQIRQGIRIALIGSVNAGKSSLFNALIGNNRAIVTEQPGTTRDVIESGFYNNGMYWTLADTAGLRQTSDFIEQEGIKRSLSEAQKADIILLIIDNARSMQQEEQEVYKQLYREFQHKIIVIHNKIDLPTQAPSLFNEFLQASCVKQASIASIVEAIQNKVKQLFNSLNAPYLINQRHYNLLIQLEKSLINIKPLLETQNRAYELIAYHLNDAIAQCAQIVGKSVSELALNAVFKEFCVGK